VFTGIVEELGRVRIVEPNEGGVRLVIDAARVIEDAAIGDSVAVNGCCLTIVALDDRGWAADAVVETLDRTSLGGFAPGDPVNLERSVRVSGRLSGHVVQGHVDGVATVVERTPLADGSTRFEFAVPVGLLRYVVEKGSIALDGISLTVAAVDDDRAVVEAAVIPHTLAVTTLGSRHPGDRVNVEVDILAKHVERLLATKE